MELALRSGRRQAGERSQRGLQQPGRRGIVVGPNLARPDFRRCEHGRPRGGRPCRIPHVAKPLGLVSLGEAVLGAAEIQLPGRLAGETVWAGSRSTTGSTISSIAFIRSASSLTPLALAL